MNKFFKIFSILIWVISIGFSDDNTVLIPAKKISKSIEKIWKTEDYELDEITKKSCLKNGRLFEVMSSDIKIGSIYSGRVNSCKSGGCSADVFDADLAFEYFDYFLLLDTNNQVVWVKVYNYQATQGHEVMSRGWLNQFKGLLPGESLEFGRDIEAISGATVSASALTEDIQRVLSCL